MTRRRTFAIWVLILLLLTLTAGGFWLRQTWHEFRQNNGIRQLGWQGIDLSLRGITVAQLSIVQEQAGRRIRARGEGLTMQWRWSEPQLEVVSLDDLNFELHQLESGRESGAPSASNLPVKPPFWLPEQVSVKALRAELPCEAGRCKLSGSLALNRQTALLPLEAELVLKHEGHEVRVDANISGALEDKLSLEASIAVDETRHLELTSSYEPQREDGTGRWSGTLDVPALPQTDWILAWLQQWQPIPLENLPPRPEAGRLSAKWQLRGAPTQDFLTRVSGTVTAQVNLPEPWPIPGIATAQGNLELALVAEDGQWLAKTARADLNFSDLAGWINFVPEAVRPNSLALRVRPAELPPELQGKGTFLPLKVDLAAQGPAPGEFESNLAVAMTAPWRVKFDATRLTASLPDRSLEDWNFVGASADISFSGRADANGLEVDFLKDSGLMLKRASNGNPRDAIALEDTRIDISGFDLAVAYSLENRLLKSLSYQGPVTASVQKLSHARLNTVSWQFAGRINGDSAQLAGAGKVNAGTGADVDVSLVYQFDGDLEADAKMEISGEAGAKAWSDVFADWPETLSIDDGTLEVVANLWVPRGRNLNINGKATLQELSGIYDRMAWTGLDGQVTFDLNDSWLNLEAPALTLSKLNPGIAVGPLMFDLRYQASPDNILSGELALDEASADFLGGTVTVASGFWNLSDMPLRMMVGLEKIELSELMKVYPAEGLAGTGTLTGQVPVLIGPDGVEVQKGKVTALEPGGTLKLPADRLRGMAQGNQAMQLVVRAVENFNYSVLNSTIDYKQDGTLILDLHLRGSSPDVQDGHPIVLNITLEEDIPALLTSLQLSGRVNDAITEKVRKLLEKGEVDDIGIEAE
jgi:hypothetical protein